jgi:hypothetical protein
MLMMLALVGMTGAVATAQLQAVRGKPRATGAGQVSPRLVSGAIKWEETFAGTAIPPGWQTIDADSSGSGWSFRQSVAFTSGDTVLPQAGSSFWFSSFSNAAPSGLINEYIITPRLPVIAAGDSLHFYAGSIAADFPDSIRVFISTTDSALSSFTQQIGYFRVEGPAGSWHLYSFDLSAFAGSPVFIAVNYYIIDGGPNGDNSDNLWVDHFILTGVGTAVGGDASRPSAFALSQNYPNPFNPSTHIAYSIAAAGHVRLAVFNLLGAEVAVLVDSRQGEGRHEVEFDGHSLPSGLYFYTLESAGGRLTKRMVLLR